MKPTNRSAVFDDTPMNRVNCGGPILAFNPGHDGAVVVLQDQFLSYSIEAEHDSYPRHTLASAHLLLEAMAKMTGARDHRNQWLGARRNVQMVEAFIL